MRLGTRLIIPNSFVLPERLDHASDAAGFPRIGFIYVIQCHEYVKIGIATNVVDRFSGMQTGCPYDLRLIGAWAISSPRIHEKIIHQHWETYWVRGEWFRLPMEVMDRITIVKMPALVLARIIMPANAFEEFRVEIANRNPAKTHDDYTYERTG